jgi:hypothetical protein
MLAIGVEVTMILTLVGISYGTWTRRPSIDREQVVTDRRSGTIGTKTQKSRTLGEFGIEGISMQQGNESALSVPNGGRLRH